MTDHFAVLNEPRRPWLDVEALKGKFLAHSASLHPDRVHTLSDTERAVAQKQYTQLNAAYNCLREPKERLRHLLELETGPLAKDVQRIPSELMDLSLEIGQACRQADALLAEKNKITSPLLKVQFFERGQDCSEKLEALQKKVNALNDSALERIKQADNDWNHSSTAKAEVLRRLEQIYQLLGYFSRWNKQLQERILKLSF